MKWFWSLPDTQRRRDDLVALRHDSLVAEIRELKKAMNAINSWLEVHADKIDGNFDLLLVQFEKTRRDLDPGHNRLPVIEDYLQDAVNRRAAQFEKLSAQLTGLASKLDRIYTECSDQTAELDEVKREIAAERRVQEAALRACLKAKYAPKPEKAKRK